MSDWVNPGKAHNEHILSGLPPIATDARTSSIGSSVPVPDVSASLGHLDPGLFHDPCPLGDLRLEKIAEV